MVLRKGQGDKIMPELPEVEVCRRGIEPGLVGQRIAGLVVRNARLRQPVPAELSGTLPGSEVLAVRRRGKYLLIDCSTPVGTGTLIVHLGMSGRLRFAPLAQAAQKHDHVDLVFAHTVLRFTDPRRFGLILWQPGPPQAVLAHPLLAHLGVEPLTEEFTAPWLQAALARRHSPIKPVLMDSHLLVGVGNIYASESLFRAGISPLRAANRIASGRIEQLTRAIRATLTEAIAAGGSSIRDYVHTDGSPGWFQIQAAVYERGGEPCRRCSGTVRQIRQAGRSTYYCPACQR